MSNYKVFFETLKGYLVELGVDKNNIEGCTNEEIFTIENRLGNLPLAYKEYLSNIGKKFLFEFMDAEDMAFEDLEYIENFAKEVFRENKLKIERPYIVISERRNDYITLIYLDEGDNPTTWVMSEFWHGDSSDLVIRTDTFIDLIIIFFLQTLLYFPASFYFVTKEEQKDEDVVKKRYSKWYRGLKKIRESIKENSENNEFLKKLNSRFLSFYHTNEKLINQQLNNNNNSSLKENYNTNKFIKLLKEILK